jgi:hypothetical protein
MKDILSYIIKSIRGNRRNVESRQTTPGELRKWDIFMLDLKAATFSLALGVGLFIALTSASSSEPWSQEREDEEFEEFGIRPLENQVPIIPIEPVKIVPILDTITSYDSLGNVTYIIGPKSQIDSLIITTINDTTKAE